MPKQLYFWAVLVWSGVITFFCLAKFNNVPLGNVTNLDKVVHAFFYFVLTTLSFLFLKNRNSGVSASRYLIFSFLFSVVFGIGIEIIQGYFTDSRHADVLDVLANTSGAALSILLLVLFGLNKVKTKS